MVSSSVFVFFFGEAHRLCRRSSNFWSHRPRSLFYITGCSACAVTSPCGSRFSFQREPASRENACYWWCRVIATFRNSSREQPVRPGIPSSPRMAFVEGEEEIHPPGMRFVLWGLASSMFTPDRMLVIAGCFIIPQSLCPDAAVSAGYRYIIPDHARCEISTKRK